MAAANIPRMLLVLLFISTLQAAIASSTSTSQTYENYIKTSCDSSTYPQSCYNFLFPYASLIKANPQKLCKTALSITLEAARNASTTVSTQLKQEGLTRFEAAVIKDCVVNIKNSIDELQKSLDAMNYLSGFDKKFQIDNIKTWLSSALTDENTCVDSFKEGQKVSATVKNKIKNSILEVAWLTSNALCFINGLTTYV